MQNYPDRTQQPLVYCRFMWCVKQITLQVGLADGSSPAAVTGVSWCFCALAIVSGAGELSSRHYQHELMSSTAHNVTTLSPVSIEPLSQHTPEPTSVRNWMSRYRLPWLPFDLYAVIRTETNPVM